MPTERNITPCRACGAPMWWLKMQSGATMPVDPEPSEQGNVVVNADGLGVVLKRAALETPEAIVARPRYVSHFVTCPQREGFRKQKGHP